jgi:putative membrane protein
MPQVIPITGALAAMLIAAPGAVAQVTSNQDTATSPWRTPTLGKATDADTVFIRQAIRGNYTEVALGRLAESRTDDSAVKDFAERMVEDHNAMNKEWVDLAEDNEMKVSIDFGPSGEQAIERLEDLDGRAFDQVYMTEMIRHHEQDLSTFRRMASSASSSEVRQLASTGASTIQQHLALAQQVGNRVGVSSTAGRVGGVPTPVPTPSSDDRARRTTPGDGANADGANAEDRDDRNDDRASDERASLSGADRAFVNDVLRDHLMHIRLADRAERQGSEQTQDLAERIEKAFTKWSDRWEDLADRRDTEVSSKLSAHNREKLERLEKAKEGKEFDRAYADLVADHLELMVQNFQDAGQRTQTPAVRRLAQDELPMLRDLRSRAERLDREQ